MSMIDSQQPIHAEDIQIATDSLPPRHTRHGKRREESAPSEQDRIDSRNKGKGFYYIQIILYTFLALIAAIIIYYYVNTQNQEAMLDKQVVDPLESFLEQQAQNGNKPSSEVIAPAEEQENQTHDYGQQEGFKEDWPDNKQLVKDKATEVPDVVRTEQEKEYPEQAYTGSPGESERVEEPPQKEVHKPKVRTVHTVQEGETLYSITIQHYKSKDYLNYLAEFNGIKDPTTDVKVGMKIQIPEP